MDAGAPQNWSPGWRVKSCYNMKLYQPQLAAYPFEGREGEVQVLPRVGRRELTPDPGVALGDDGVAETRDEHALLEQQLAHPDGLGRLPQNHRHDRRLARERLEPQGDEPLAEIPGVVVQPADELGVLLEVAQGGEGTAGHGGWQGIREQL